MQELINRKVAQELGRKRYYTGTPCKSGHLCERFVSSGGCCDCVNWKTSHGTVNKSAANLCFPERAFFFSVACTRDEMEASLRYVAHMRWHESALAELRKNPELMRQFGRAPTAADLAAARALINQEDLRRIKAGEI